MNTKVELKEVRAAVPRECLVTLSTGNSSAEDVDGDVENELEGKYTTASAILSRLPGASVLHLACHADQDPSNPLESGFIVKDGERLTVRQYI